MTLMEQLNEDMKTAMKAREEGKSRLSVIRLIKTSIQYQEVEKGSALTEEEITAVIARELKQRRDVLPDYEKSGRDDMVKTLHDEIHILMDYLPRQLEESELRAMISETIAETGAAGPKDMGKVMSKISAAVKGKADGRIVSALVKEMLENLG